ncbi:MAG TPA: DUF6279 family lipoprotein [Ramlibacter sp.]
MKPLDSTRIAGIILGLALVLALSACSAVKLGYNNLPHLTYWWLDGYVDFSDEQAPRVRDEIAALHAWHRQQELPKVLELLARMEQLAPGEISAQQACSIVGELQARMRALGERAEPGVIGIAATLTGRELRHMNRKFRRNNERFHEEWVALAPADRAAKRYEKMLERVETIYGPLQEPQRALLRQRLEQSVYDPARSALEWQRRQQDLLQILRRLSHPGQLQEAEARALLRGWLARIEKAPDPAYRAYQEALLQEGCATFVLVHQSTTAAQREQAVRRLRAYQRDVRDLMAQAS